MSQVNDIPVYEVKPKGEVKGGLIVIHEVWGLTDHIKDVTDRFGEAGYYAMAPNLLSDIDIERHLTPELQHDLFNPEKRNAVQPKLRELMTPIWTPEFAKETTLKLEAVFSKLYGLPVTKQKVAVIGYCFGGTYSYNLAISEPRLIAAIPYYGHCQHSVQELSRITCPVLAFYGQKDENLMKDLPELEEKMHQAKVDFSYQVYDDAGHAFFNDTNPYAYNQSAAQDAWKRTAEFLDNRFNR